MLLLLLIFTGCEAENTSSENPNSDRVDTVNKLLNKTQIVNYILKYKDELGIDKTIDNVDSLINDGHPDYVPDKGSRSSDHLDIVYDFIKHENQHYIDVNLIYTVTFTYTRFNGITHVVQHRDFEYDIGKFYIKLNVDYNEDGYLLNGRKIVSDISI